MAADILQSFSFRCCCYLIGNSDVNKVSNYLRKHKENLSKLGDFSFSPYGLSMTNIDKVMEEILNESLAWSLHISKCNRVHVKMIIYLDRLHTFEELLRVTSVSGQNYGQRPPQNKSVYLSAGCGTAENTDLSNLRVCLQKEVCRNFLVLMGYNVELIRPSKTENLSELYFYSLSTSAESLPPNATRFPCAIVVNVKDGLKESKTMAADYRKMRMEDMKIISEHKYGHKVKLESGWEELLCCLRDAAVTMDLLCTKPSRIVSLNLEPNYVRIRQSSSKGAAFVMYNCARISEILKQFKMKVAGGFYPPLISMEEVDFSLLSQEEEWQLLFNYILVYPSMIQESVENFEQGNVRPDLVCNFLTGMCSSFSVYYRRVRILTGSSDHPCIVVLHPCNDPTLSSLALIGDWQVFDVSTIKKIVINVLSSITHRKQ